MGKPQEHEPLVDSTVVMRYLDVSDRQLRRLLKDTDERGRPQTPLPSVEGVGSRRKFLMSEVRAWLDARRVNTGRLTSARR